MSALLGTSADWYLMRASGFVALILLTATVGLGIAHLARFERGRWTRTVAALVHRNVSLLAVVFLTLHIGTALGDRYVDVPALSVVVPGMSGYDPLWVGLGAVSVDLLVAVAVTSLLRARLRQRTWQLVHWLSYLTWPTAVAHSLGSGSGSGVDTGATWSTAIYVTLGLAFAAAVVVRLTSRGEPDRTPRPSGGGRPPTYATRSAAPAEATGSPTPRRPAVPSVTHRARRSL